MKGLPMRKYFDERVSKVSSFTGLIHYLEENPGFNTAMFVDVVVRMLELLSTEEKGI